MTPTCDEDVGGDTAATTVGMPEVTIRPAAAAWSVRLVERQQETANAQFRRELGLPIDRSVIMSGHQAQVWHPGILSKLMALRAASEKLGAAAGWVVVDHDENDPLTVRAPYIGADGRLAETSFGPATGATDGVPSCRRPTWKPTEPWDFPIGGKPASPGEIEGLARIRETYVRHAGLPDAASQSAAAAFELAAPFSVAPTLIRASTLAQTTLFAELVRRMHEDPRACVDAHNAAVSALPHERIAPLATEGGALELPLWSIEAGMGSGRQRVFATDLARLPIERLAPRALLLTGLLRLAGCDLFIHGLGGERYDRITDLWLGGWLGKPLAHTAMVTATTRLRVPGCWPAAATIAKAAWTAHKSKHDPATLGDSARAEAKQAMLRRIDAAPRKSRERAALFLQLHRLLEASRTEHAGELDRIAQDAAAMLARSDESAIATDRTWAFPLFEQDQLSALHDRVRTQFM